MYKRFFCHITQKNTCILFFNKKNSNKRLVLIFFIYEKSSLLLATALIAGVSEKAKSYDFSDKIYGKATASIGYTFQRIGNSAFKDRIKVAEEFGNEMVYNYHAINIGIGYDVYYKWLDSVHPFVGLDIDGRIPVKNDVFIKDPSGLKWPKGYLQIADFLSVDLKFGSKFILNKENALQVYGLFGMNLIQTSTQGQWGAGGGPNADGGAVLKEVKVGLNAGGGVSYIYNYSEKLAFLTALEYKYSYAKNIADENVLYEALAGDGSRRFKDYAMHQASIKFGVQFL